MNAVAMNLEVARLRAAPGADAGRVAPFAGAAAEAHEEAVALVRALTALARLPLDAPCDAREVAGHVVALLAPGVRARGGALALDAPDAARTAASAATVCADVADVLLRLAAEPAVRVRCVLTAGGDGTAGGVPTLAFVSDENADGRAVAPPLAFPSG